MRSIKKILFGLMTIRHRCFTLPLTRDSQMDNDGRKTVVSYRESEGHRMPTRRHSIAKPDLNRSAPCDLSCEAEAKSEEILRICHLLTGGPAGPVASCEKVPAGVIYVRNNC
jgi:hypothetical protein